MGDAKLGKLERVNVRRTRQRHGHGQCKGVTEK